MSLSLEGLKNLARKFDLPDTDADYLISEITGLSIPDITHRRSIAFSDNIPSSLESWLIRRTRGEPMQYITGNAYFRHLKLHVEPGVLIPRPETEQLVELALPIIPDRARVCDVGSGSGAIALAIATERPDTTVHAIDTSKKALSIASGNARELGVTNVTFHHSDLFESLPASDQFHLIISNPPYVTRCEYETLSPEVKDFEPQIALISGEDGLDCVRRLLAQTPTRLSSGGYLALELGHAQADTVSSLLESMKEFSDIVIKKDHNEIRRFVIAKKNH